MSQDHSTLLPSNAVAINGTRATTTSLIVSDVFGKRHDHVLRDIDALDCSPDFRLLNFGESFRETETGNGTTRRFRYFELTKDGFTFLAMGYTGPKAAAFKEAYITRFNAMEAQLHQATLPVPPAATIADPLEQSVRDYLSAQLEATPPAKRASLFVNPDAILVHLGLSHDTAGRTIKVQIGRIARDAGWVRTHPRQPGQRTRGYRPGHALLIAAPTPRHPAPAPRTIQVYDHRDPRVNGDPLPAPDPLAHPDVRKAIHRKAHALSHASYEHNVRILEDWLRSQNGITDPDAAIARIHTLTLDHGQCLMVDTQQLWAVTAHVAATERCLTFALDAIRTLEQSTGKQLYGRPQGAGV